MFARCVNSFIGVDCTVARTVSVSASSLPVEESIVLDSLSIRSLECARSEELPTSVRGWTPSANATNEVTRFLSGSDICSVDIVDITTPKSAVVGASYICYKLINMMI